MRKIIIGIIIGILVSTTGILAANYLYKASDIEYNPEDNSWNVENVQSAISDLYSMTNNGGTCTEDTCEYSYTGSYQVFTAPKNGTYLIELWGASGGTNATLSGRGAYTSGKLSLSAGEKLYVYVGESNDTCNSTFNGGGYCLNTSTSSSGGGSTDVRYFSSNPTLADLSWISSKGLKSRIMVAGAGAGYTTKSAYSGEYHGGNAGGLQGSSGSGFYAAANQGGTQVNAGGGSFSGGAYISGSFGMGAPAISSSGGTGGAGYYGGSSGYEVNYGTSGGGGSSYISGYLGCVAVTNSDGINGKCTQAAANSDVTCSHHYSGKVFTDSVMKSGSEEMTSPTGTTETGHLGNGYVKITFIQ